jgi:ferredoxin-type protein NapH
MNLLSPYVSISAAAEGIVSGSLVVFILMFLTSTFLGRAWCGWACPMAGLAEACAAVNPKPVNLRRMRISRYVIFGIWASVLVLMFFLAKGIHGVSILFYMESGVSVDMPVKYIIYYGVLLIFLIVSFAAGRRGACQAFCWMAPFMTGGYWTGRFLRMPQLRIRSDAAKCTACGSCTKRCPMSIDVQKQVDKGFIGLSDCILCGECVDGCPRKVLRYGINTRRGTT